MTGNDFVGKTYEGVDQYLDSKTDKRDEMCILECADGIDEKNFEDFFRKYLEIVSVAPEEPAVMKADFDIIHGAIATLLTFGVKLRIIEYIKNCQVYAVAVVYELPDIQEKKYVSIFGGKLDDNFYAANPFTAFIDAISNFAENCRCFYSMYPLGGPLSNYGPEITEFARPVLGDESAAHITVVGTDCMDGKTFNCNKTGSEALRDYYYSIRVKKAVLELTRFICGHYDDYRISIREKTFGFARPGELKDDDADMDMYTYSRAGYRDAIYALTYDRFGYVIDDISRAAREISNKHHLSI